MQIVCDIRVWIQNRLNASAPTAHNHSQSGAVSACIGIRMHNNTDRYRSPAIVRTVVVIMILNHDQITKAQLIDSEFLICLCILRHNVVISQHGGRTSQMCIRDRDPGTPYRDMDRSIFMNPESSNNARVITPAAPYEIVAMNHRIDLFAYANNYDDKLGLHRFDTLEDAKATCKEGKRMAKGTTQEVGISTTYFANPFGPMQQQEVCELSLIHI